ncbi:hypothetical protein ACIQZO_29640 [Streptomyces sp. NPDC097617]
MRRVPTTPPSYLAALIEAEAAAEHGSAHDALDAFVVRRRTLHG